MSLALPTLLPHPLLDVWVTGLWVVVHMLSLVSNVVSLTHHLIVPDPQLTPLVTTEYSTDTLLMVYQQLQRLWGGRVSLGPPCNIHIYCFPRVLANSLSSSGPNQF